MTGAGRSILVGEAPRACVIGWPIAHSRSPMIHGHWLARYHLPGSYEKVAVRPEEIADFVSRLADHGYVGCNVTVPHKEVAFALAAERDPSAIAVGAANTLWLDGGKLHAANTDTYGYMTYLASRAPRWARRDAPVCVLGAGGAARAIVYGFLEAGVSEVRVFNRSRDRAEALAADFARTSPAGGYTGRGRVVVCDWSEREEKSRSAAVIVNTTSLGLKGEGDVGIDFSRFDLSTVVSEIVYAPLETSFLAAARSRGLMTVDGLGMLLHQAVPGFERWFGVRPAVTADLYGLIAADVAKG
jgi:shikimate dehydrogenase